MATIPQRARATRTATGTRLAAPYVSVVVINYCQWRNTDRVAHQLLDADAIDNGLAEIIIVDNDSPTSPVVSRLRRTPQVQLKTFSQNTGFARAANEGFRLAKGEWVLLLNPDTAVPEGFLDQLEAQCRAVEHEEPNAGVLGLALRHADGSEQASAGAPPTLLRTLGGLFVPRRVRKCHLIEGANRVAVPWVTGCGMLVRKSCWADLGGFDESFFLYYEDADFCRRAWEHDWSVWFEPTLRLTHYKPLHVRPVPPELRLMTRHALLTYARKHWRGWQAKAMAGVVWCEALARQWTARRRGASPALAGELRRLAGDWLWDQPLAARARIRQTAKLLANCAGREDGDFVEPI